MKDERHTSEVLKSRWWIARIMFAIVYGLVISFSCSAHKNQWERIVDYLFSMKSLTQQIPAQKFEEIYVFSAANWVPNSQLNPMISSHKEIFLLMIGNSYISCMTIFLKCQWSYRLIYPRITRENKRSANNRTQKHPTNSFVNNKVGKPNKAFGKPWLSPVKHVN